MKRILILLLFCVSAAAGAFHLLCSYSTGLAVATLLILTLVLGLFVLLEGVALSRWLRDERLTSLRLLTAAIGLSLWLAEGLLRVAQVNPTYLETIGVQQYQSPYWPDKKDSFWHVHEPNDSIHFFRGEFHYNRRINSEGFAERPIDRKDTTVKKILTLGDSFTEGIGATADSTWPRQLEQYLQAATAESLLVYNAGIGGSDPMYEYHLLKGKLWNTPWAAVVFSINNTDIAECLIRGGMQRFKANGTVQFSTPPVWEPLYAASHLVRFIVLNICRYSWMLLSEAETKQKEHLAVQQIAATLHRAHAELQARHIPLLVVLQPMSYDVMHEGYSSSQMDTLEALLQPIPLVNLIPYYRDTLHYTKQSYKEIYWPVDGHFNATGYGLMAKEISRQLLPLCCPQPDSTAQQRP